MHGRHFGLKNILRPIDLNSDRLYVELYTNHVFVFGSEIKWLDIFQKIDPRITPSFGEVFIAYAEINQETVSDPISKTWMLMYQIFQTRDCEGD